MAVCSVPASVSLPASISIQTIHETKMPDNCSELDSWEKIKDFFFNNHIDDAMHYFLKLCNPQPDISREGVEDTFFQLKELAAPGHKNNFFIEGNSSLDKCFYRITNKNGGVILSIFIGTNEI